MDVNQSNSVFEEFEEKPQRAVYERTENVEKCTFSLPESDYGKNGKLKKVRGRMLKKLLKYEFRAIFPPLFITLAVLFGVTVLMGILVNIPQTEKMVLFMVFAIMLYIYALIAAVLISLIIAIGRHNKNFFKEEGYLTFSIPASMEEHILAKHLSGVISTLIGVAAALLSLGIVLLISAGNLMELGLSAEIISIENPVSFAFEIIEGLILFAETLVGIQCVAGALNCWEQKIAKKRKIVLYVLLAYIIFVVVETLYFSFIDTAFIEFFYTTTGIHVSNWLKILLYAGIITFCVWYELRTLKKNLNLK